MPTISPHVRGQQTGNTGAASRALLERVVVQAHTTDNPRHAPAPVAPEIAPSQPAQAAAPVTAPSQPIPPEATPIQQAAKVAETTAPGQTAIKEETITQAVTLSPQLSALARKEQKFHQEQKAFREEKEQWEKEKADFIPKSDFKTKLQANAAEALKTLGLDYNELTDLLLNQSNTDDPVKKLQAEVESLKSAQTEQVSKQYEATVNQYRQEISKLVQRDPNLVTIKEKAAEKVVLQHILDTFEKEGEILSVDEAAKDVEDYLVEDALKNTRLTKVKAKLPPQDLVESKKTLPPPQRSQKTLTNSVESAPQRTLNQFQHLSPKERLMQAIARAQR